MNKLFKGALFLLFLPVFSGAQNFVGSEFRLSFIKNLNPTFNTPPIFDISIHALEGLDATVEYGLPTDPFYETQTISINANEVGVVSFDQDQFLNQETLNVVETRSFLITTTGEARVYAFHNRLYFSDSSPILPTTSLGNDYLITSFEQSGGAYPSIFNVTGTVDNTSVDITPTSGTLLGGAGDTFTVNLDAGEVISISSSGDLTGSRVTSQGALIAVSGGHQQSLVGPPGCGADSHLWEQYIPISDWTTSYPIFPLNGNDGDLFRILALNDNTQLYSGCDLIATIDAGEFYEEFYDSPFILTSSEPVSVAAYMRGNDCAGTDTGDPNMRMLLPLKQGNTNIKLRVENPLQDGGPFGGDALHAVHLVMLTAETSGLSLNGNNVTTWQAFNSQPGLSYAEIEIDDLDNLLSIESTSPFWSELISLKAFDAFTMSLGSDAEITLPPLDLTIVSLGPDQTICPGQSIILDPGLGISGTWQDDSFQETYTVVEPGTYSVTVEDACGDGSDEVIISEGFVPTVVLPSELIICGGDIEFIEVEEEPGVTYTWSTEEEGGTIEVDGFGTYTVTAISQDGCESEASTEVLDGATAEVILTAPEAICENSVDSILASANEAGAFTWSDGTIGSKLTISESGDYSVIFVPESGCEVEEEVSVDQLFAPFVFANDTVICDGDVIQIRAQSPNGDAFWPGISDSSVASISEEGAYEAAAENECGIAFFTVSIGFKDCSCPAFLPNAFTPNGDGLNDLFVPNILCEPDFYELVIFNRWGKEVFSSTDITKNWNGDSKNNPDFFSSEGVYNYILKFDNPLRPLQSPQEITGTVTLIR
ncbi:gliding motility-associated C-terminal domain-containing protein [Cryomorphaceae bacterium 1068]|nr:gliding motility-associated C-terminal domain-containing protein [Cryomorphaceae bacterium 1068]